MRGMKSKLAEKKDRASEKAAGMKGKAREQKDRASEKAAGMKGKAREKAAAAKQTAKQKRAGGGAAPPAREEEAAEEDEPEEPVEEEEPAVPDSEIMALFPPQMRGEPDAALDPEFDAVRYALENLEPDVDEAALEEQVQAAERGVDISHRELTEMVMGGYDSFSGAIDQLGGVEARLAACMDDIRAGRASLRQAEQEVVQGGIQVLHKLRQKKLYTEVVSLLLKLKQLLQYEKQCLKAEEKKDFPRIILSAERYMALVPEFKDIQSVEASTVRRTSQSLARAPPRLLTRGGCVGAAEGAGGERFAGRFARGERSDAVQNIRRGGVPGAAGGVRDEAHAAGAGGQRAAQLRRHDRDGRIHHAARAQPGGGARGSAARADAAAEEAEPVHRPGKADEVVGLLRIVDGALLQAGGDHEHDVRIRDLAQGCQGRSAAV